MRLDGIHHISAITADAAANVDFYTRVMGLRLVARSVNQDDPRHHHLFFGDERGSPGADITFFEYRGLPPGRAGSGMVHRILWRVTAEAALDFWGERLGDEGLAAERDGEGLLFSDPEGLGHGLVVDGADAPLRARHPGIPRRMALRGFAGVRAYARAPERSGALLTDVLGAASAGPGTWELRGPGRGSTIAFDPPPAERALRGTGTVHHVAWAATAADHPRWHRRLRDAGVRVTDVIDRHYFHAMYFREPSGVLYEIADDAPGFAGGTPLAELGTRLLLPPWLEPRRAEIAAGLTPLPTTPAGAA